MKLLDNKRGATTKAMKYFLDIVFSLIVFMALFTWVGSKAEDTSFEREFLARDIALLLDTLHASPGNVVIDYPQKTLWFSFKIGDGKVSVYDKTQPAITAVNTYGKNKNIGLEEVDMSPQEEVEKAETAAGKLWNAIKNPFSVSTPEMSKNATLNLRFVKIGDEIMIGEQEELQFNLNELSCPDLDITEDPETQTVLIHPGVSSMIVGERKISSLTYTLASLVEFNSKTAFKEVIVTRAEEDEIGVEAVKAKIEEKDENLFLAVDIKESGSEMLVIKAYYIREESQYLNSKKRKLACEILNKITKEFPDIVSASYIPLDAENLGDDKKAVLGAAQTGVYLEISNTEKTKELFDDSEKMNKLAEAITNGLKAYYGK